MAAPTPTPPDEESLFALAGARSFDRGVDYAEEDRVQDLRRLPGDAVGVEASVTGTHPYAVRLEFVEQRLNASCACPMGAAGAFCKHCVAVGLVWRIAYEDDIVLPMAGDGQDSPDDATVRAYLEEMSHASLVELVCARAAEDDVWHERLLRRAQLHSGNPDLKRLERVLDDAICVEGFVDYRSGSAYYAGVDHALEMLPDLIAAGQGEAAIGLAEHALRRLEDAIQNVDGSDGGMTILLNKVERQHLAACEQARPDPIELAERIFDWRVTSDWDTFSGVVTDYAEVLGEDGLRELRRLGSTAFDRLPELRAGQRGESFRNGRFALRKLMEDLAGRSGDPDELAAVMARDLSSPYAYLQIAEVYREAGRPDAALDWAERGREAFPDAPDRRLTEFLQSAYQAAGRTDEALALLWEAYVQSPGPVTFAPLHELATATGAAESWRNRAFAHLHQVASQAEQQPAQRGRGFGVRGMHTSAADACGALVRMHLLLRETTSAWREADAGPCPLDALLELAGGSGPEFRARAAEVYELAIERELRTAGKPQYRRAAQLCKRLREKYAEADDADGWSTFEKRLRDSQRRRPKFQEILTDALHPTRRVRAGGRRRGRA